MTRGLLEMRCRQVREPARADESCWPIHLRTVYIAERPKGVPTDCVACLADAERLRCDRSKRVPVR